MSRCQKLSCHVWSRGEGPFFFGGVRIYKIKIANRLPEKKYFFHPLIYIWSGKMIYFLFNILSLFILDLKKIIIIFALFKKGFIFLIGKVYTIRYWINNYMCYYETGIHTKFHSLKFSWSFIQNSLLKGRGLNELFHCRAELWKQAKYAKSLKIYQSYKLSFKRHSKPKSIATWKKG